jgi:hypothetical protein
MSGKRRGNNRDAYLGSDTIGVPFLVVDRPLLNILARDAAKDGFSATIKAVFILVRYLVHSLTLRGEIRASVAEKT